MSDTDLPVHFKQITAANVLDVCRLSLTLSEPQRSIVTDNSVSIAQGHCSANAWMRAIYAGETLVGFVMLHFGSDFDDGIDCDGVFLWRLMIAEEHQGKGYGKQAIQRLTRFLQKQGYQELYTCYGLGEGSPEHFYKKLGFVETGDGYGDEPEVVLRFLPPTEVV